MTRTAEFRGPGIHHNFDDSDSGYDVDMDQKPKTFGGNQRGRIILLGDGTEVLTDSDDTEMFDHQEEDKDLDSQVHKGQISGREGATNSKPSTDAEEKKEGTDTKNHAAPNGFLTNSTESKGIKVEEKASDAKDQ
jgi:protein phosphatase PTC2/3